MQISKILLIDNDNKVKRILLEKLRNSIEDLDIYLLKKKKDLDVIIKKMNAKIILVNYDLKWADSFKLLKELGENYPFIGKIVFSTKNVNIMVKGQENIVDGIIYYVNSSAITKIREESYIRSGNSVSSIVTKQYNASGLLIETLKQTYTRSAGKVVSVNWSKS